MKLQFLGKDLTPDAIAEGWGETSFVYEYNPVMNLTSGLGNCGIGVLNNISCQWVSAAGGVSKKTIPKEVWEKYFDHWGSLCANLNDALDKIQNDFVKANQTKIFKEVVDRASKQGGLHCFVLSDGVNKHHPVRSGINADTWRPSTVWFARKLVEHKEGYVVQSPLAVNKSHYTPTDFGLVRVWIWFPKGALAFKPERYLGYGTLLTKEQLAEKISNSGNFKGFKLSKYTVEDYIDSYKV